MSLSTSSFTHAFSNMNPGVVTQRRFIAMYGVPPEVCPIIWTHMEEDPEYYRGLLPRHLLWALLFLKVYATEEIHVALCGGVDPKTYRRHVWLIVGILSRMDVIKWDNRIVPANENSHVRVSVDGTDCRIQEPTPFDKRWFSHKFKKSGLRYELGICIANGHIVWANGPFPCGSWPDLKIAQFCFCEMLEGGELAVADKGYKDPHFVSPHDTDGEITRMCALARARHETCNRRLKQFRCLTTTFRHDLGKHSACFHAVANITQIMIENGHPLFEVPFSTHML